MRRIPCSNIAGASAIAIAIALATYGRVIGGEHGHADSGRHHFFHRFGPAGGWHPDDGGLLHWWNPHCFPRCGGPDDYCRKPPPQVCWPPYPPYYIWDSPEAHRH